MGKKILGLVLVVCCAWAEAATPVYTFPARGGGASPDGVTLDNNGAGSTTQVIAVPKALVTGLGANVGTALGSTLNGSGALVATTSPTFGTSILTPIVQNGSAAATGILTLKGGSNISGGTILEVTRNGDSTASFSIGNSGNITAGSSQMSALISDPTASSFALNSTGLNLPVSKQVTFTASANATVSIDAGLARNAAGQLKPTDGTSGAGAFFLPNKTASTTPTLGAIVEAVAGTASVQNTDGSGGNIIVKNGTQTVAGDITFSGNYTNFTGTGTIAGIYFVGSMGGQRSSIRNGPTVAGVAGGGVIVLFDDGGIDFKRLQFGGTTSSFPCLKRNSTALNVRLADDSADAPITASDITSSGSINTSASTTVRAGLKVPSGTAPTSPVDGDIWYDGTHFYGRAGGATKQLDN